MGSKWAVRAAAGVAAIVMAASGAPVAADPAPAREGAPVAPDLGIRLRMLRQLQELDPSPEIVEALTATDKARVRRGRSVAAYPVKDVSGDGIAEVIERDVRYSLVIDETGQEVNTIAEDEFTTIVRVRDGRTGRLRWKKRYEDYVVVGRAMVGDPARPGLIAIGGILSFFGGSSGARYLDFHALRGDSGKRIWSKTYTSVAASYDFTTTVVTDSPISFAFVQARKDDATEILIGLSTLTESLFTTTAATRALLLSAADGTDTFHPTIDVGVNWLPFPDAVPDVDGDSLDDYVVINDTGFYAGEGQDPPAIGGIIHARRGLDGAGVWTEGGLEFRYFAWTIPLADVVGDGRRDFGILTYNSGTSSLLPALPIVPNVLFERDHTVVMLTDAGAGDVIWTKRGFWVHSPGDLDGDRDADVVLERPRFDDKDNAIHYTRLAFPGAGKRIWRYHLVWHGTPCPARRCLAGGGAVGLGPAGDVHPDAIGDRFLWMALFQPPDTEDYATFVLKGDADQTLIRSDETLMPLGVAVDGRGADVMNARADRHEASFRARTGSTGRTLWTLRFEGPEQLLPKDVYAYGYGFSLPGDRCGDVVVNVGGEDGTLYAILDGGTGAIRWSRWSGARDQRPRATHRRDLNPAC
ncbi:MAG TPA: hypothetical protein VJ927_09905 [Actinomycetota bacterium]|nr:hypothetical protein [Actinomycetota bacterium]